MKMNCDECAVCTRDKCDYVNDRNDIIDDFAERLKRRNRLYCTNVEDANEMDFVIDDLAKKMKEEYK